MFKRLVAAMAMFTTLFSCSPAAAIITKAEEISTDEVTKGVLNTNEDSNTNLTFEEEQGAILHVWDWSFKTIEENLKAIANAGYTSIQVSPIQGNKDINGEDKLTSKWWILYQPINFKIGNKQLGTKEQFREMCQKAKEYGINVYVDIIANHTGNNGEPTQYPSCVDPDILALGDDAWHMPLKSTTDWDDRYDVTHGCVGLPDLNTENKKIQELFRNYLQECLDCGADGFRFDTAKHIGLPTDEGKCKSDFWPSVFTGLKTEEGGRPYVYGEVLQGGADNFNEYSKYINVTASNYGSNVRQAVGFKGSPDVEKIEDYKSDGVDPSKLITWVESHDTYANDSEESTAMTDEQLKNGWALIASRSDANPLFFNRPAGRGKLDGNIGDAGDDLWRDSDVVAVNKFRKEMKDKDEKLVDLSKEVMIIERGEGDDAGLVIVNMGNPMEISDQEINLSDGTYNNCASANTSFTVSNGKINGTIPEGITVLYNKGQKEENILTPQVSIDQENKSFSEDSLELTLKCTNNSNATYSINNGEKKNYVDGDKITIGENSAIGDIINVTLEATNEQGNRHAREVYKYVKKDKNSCATIYFKKGENFKKPYVYAYNELGEKNSGWPGEEMTYIGNNTYKYELRDFTDSNIAINDWFFGSNKVEGLEIKANGKKIYDETAKSWKDVTEDITEDLDAVDDSVKDGTSKVYFQKPDEWAKYDDVCIYFYGKGGPEWPGVPMKKVEGKDSLYAYTLPEGLEDSSVMFNANNGNVQIPGHNESGLKAPADSSMIYDGTWHEYVNGVSKAYFRKPKEWEEPNIYVFKDGEGKEIKEWPGIKMSKVEGTETLYSYTLPEEYATSEDKVKIVFNDGTNKTKDIDLPYEKSMIFDENGEGREFKTDDYEEPEDNDDSEDKSVTKVYFKNEDNWDKIKVYVFKNDPFGEVKKWPGVSPEDEGDGLYSYSLPKGYENAIVIFNNGGNGEQTDNLQTIAGHSMIYDKDTKALKDMTKVYFKNSEYKWEKVAVHYWNDGGASTQWPGKKMTYYGDDLYGYEMPKDFEDANVMFNNNANGQQTKTVKSQKEKTMIFDEDGTWREFTSEDVPKTSDDDNPKEDEPKDDNNESDKLTKAYFYNKDNWTDIKVYVYTEDKDGKMKKEIEKWPGVDMENEGNNLYSFVLPKGFKNSVLIFSGYATESSDVTEAIDMPEVTDNNVENPSDNKDSEEKVSEENSQVMPESNNSSDTVDVNVAENNDKESNSNTNLENSVLDDKTGLENKEETNNVAEETTNSEKEKIEVQEEKFEIQEKANTPALADENGSDKKRAQTPEFRIKDGQIMILDEDGEWEEYKTSEKPNPDETKDDDNKDKNKAVIKSVSINGIAKVGNSLTAEVLFENETMGDVNYKWQISETKDGEFTDIENANSKTYIVTSNDYGKYIRVEVSNNDTDKPVSSKCTEKVTVNSSSNHHHHNSSSSSSEDSSSDSDKDTSTSTSNNTNIIVGASNDNNKYNNGWNQNETGDWIYFEGDKQVTGWKYINNKWYYMNESGIMAKGWVKSNDIWYYLNDNGSMATGWIKYNDGNWYYLNESGAMKTGWVQDSDGKWYFMNNNGSMATGWINDNGNWYYLNNSGAMACNTVVDGYVLSYNGKWIA